jgi:hypothetical protein
MVEGLVPSSRTFWNPQFLLGTEAQHTVALPGAMILSLGDFFAQAERYFRQEAERKAEQRRTLQMIPDLTQPNLFVPAPNSTLTQLWLIACEFFWRALAGFANGLTAGYLSHLVLDAGTARSIPLLTNGF